MKQAKPTEQDFSILIKYLEKREKKDTYIGPYWRRIVYGCQVLLDNCTDKSADTLEFSPKIQRALSDNKLDIEAFKTSLDELENIVTPTIKHFEAKIKKDGPRKKMIDQYVAEETQRDNPRELEDWILARYGTNQETPDHNYIDYLIRGLVKRQLARFVDTLPIEVSENEEGYVGSLDQFILMTPEEALGIYNLIKKLKEL